MTGALMSQGRKSFTVEFHRLSRAARPDLQLRKLPRLVTLEPLDSMERRPVSNFFTRVDPLERTFSNERVLESAINTV